VNKNENSVGEPHQGEYPKDLGCDPTTEWAAQYCREGADPHQLLRYFRDDFRSD